MAKNNVFRLLFIWLLIPFVLQSQAGKPATNLEIFQNLVETLTEQIFQHIQIDSSNEIIIRSRSANTQADWLVENGFIRFCLDHKISVSMAEKPQSGDEILLEFYVNDVGVNYIKIGGKKVKRNCYMTIDVRTAKGKSLQFENLKRFSQTFEDTIFVKDIARLESKQYPFTHKALNHTNNWKKWINPTLVLLSTGVVIYSFFALRSK